MTPKEGERSEECPASAAWRSFGPKRKGDLAELRTLLEVRKDNEAKLAELTKDHLEAASLAKNHPSHWNLDKHHAGLTPVRRELRKLLTRYVVDCGDHHQTLHGKRVFCTTAGGVVADKKADVCAKKAKNLPKVIEAKENTHKQMMGQNELKIETKVKEMNAASQEVAGSFADIQGQRFNTCPHNAYSSTHASAPDLDLDFSIDIQKVSLEQIDKQLQRCGKYDKKYRIAK